MASRTFFPRERHATNDHHMDRRRSSRDDGQASLITFDVLLFFLFPNNRMQEDVSPEELQRILQGLGVCILPL